MPEWAGAVIRLYCKLHEDVNNLSAYCENNDLLLNLVKATLVIFTPGQKGVPKQLPQLALNKCVIFLSTSTKKFCELQCLLTF